MQKKELIDAINMAIMAALANTHTIVIAKVTKVDAKTINCKPVINRLVNGEEIELPEFIEVPPIFLQGGGSYIAHPIAVDDYCLLLISERCFDRWYHGEDNKRPLELRMHDYSDAFALVGVNPLASAIAIPSVTQMTGDTNQDGNYTHQGDRTQTGNYNQTGNKTQTGNHTQTGDMNITGNLTVDGNITCTGNITCSGNGIFAGVVTASSFSGPAGGTMVSSADIQTSGDVTAGGISLKNHTHPYTWTGTSGSGDTGAAQ